MNNTSVNFKNESCFFLKTFWTNGFTIWSIILEITGFFHEIPIVFAFRESLWMEQSMWVFFVPMVYQIGFRYFLQGKFTQKLKTSSKKKVFFASFVLGIVTSSIIVEYAYFAGDTLSIIADHHKDARGINYTNIPWLKALNWGLITAILAGERYRKHLVNNQEFEERHNDKLNSGIQIALITVGFSLALSTYDLLHTLPKILK